MSFDAELQYAHEYHPVFGLIDPDPIDLLITDTVKSADMENRKEEEWLKLALATIGTDEEIPPYPVRKPIYRVTPTAAVEAFTAATRTDEFGTWDLLPGGTAPQSGDEVEDEGVWRLRPPTKPRSTSPVDQYAHAVHAATQARQRVEALERQDRTEDDPELRQAREELETRNAERSAKLNALAVWERTDDADTPEGRKPEWAGIDANRQTPTGRAKYNTDRRITGRGANADLSTATPEEKAEHRRQKKAANKRAERARKSEAAKAEAARTGNLAAAIS